MVTRSHQSFLLLVVDWLRVREADRGLYLRLGAVLNNCQRLLFPAPISIALSRLKLALSQSISSIVGS